MKNVFDFDYNKSIVSVSGSILKHFHIKPFHQTLPLLDKALECGKTNVVLLILDGLGCSLLKKNLPEDSFLKQNIKDEIFSVFPPTTAAATIAYHSGLTPLESGWIGWMCYYPQYGQIIENFNNVAYYTGKTLDTPGPSKTLIKFKSIYEMIVQKNKDVDYFKIFPDFEADGCHTFAQMCRRILKATKSSGKKKIISAYWTEPDHTTHLNGVSSQEVKDVLKNIDDELKNLSKNLKDTILIISADHGLVDVEEIYINDYPLLNDMLKMPPCLEARFVTFYVKDGKIADFKKEFEKTFGNDFKLYTKDEFLKSGLLGSGKKHKCIDTSLGDFVAISTTNKSLRYRSKLTGEHFNAADHAGISEDEMKIPLIIKMF
ncbi:MAG: alkaline phosphatase family protein [Alphaproteobacteria bacterium]|nr:alkaline phosphatase family protein [Alphaproteobacteria bacterium]